MWSWVLTAASLLGLWLTGNKRREGWLVALASEGLWAAYGALTRQYGFIAMSLAFAAMHVRNWRKWKSGI